MLLTAKVHEPILARAMAAAATLLSPHALHLSSSLPLLPNAAQMKQPNAQTGWRLEESVLGNAASGARSDQDDGVPPPAESGCAKARLWPEASSHAAAEAAKECLV